MTAAASETAFTDRFGAPGDRPSLGQFALACLLIGATAFGGGAMVAFLEERFTRHYGWLRNEAFLEAVTLAQSLPGAIATNTVAFIGYRLHGAAGAVTGMAMYALPSGALMVVFAALYDRLRHFPSATAVFTGLNAAAAGLVAATAVRLGRQALESPWQHWQAVVVFGIAVGFPAATLPLIGLSLLGGLLSAGRQRELAATGPDADQNPSGRLSLRQHLFMAGLIGAAVSGLWVMAETIAEPFLQRVARLMLATLKIGGLTFGGGFVIIPLLGHEVVEVYGWLTPQEVADAAALGLLTPGPFVIAAVFLGYRVAGLTGAGVAALGIFGMPLWLVLVVAGAVGRFRHNRWMRGALRAAMPTGVALLAAAAVTIGKGAYSTAPYTWWLAPALGLASAVVVGRYHINPLVVLFGAAGLGLGSRWLFE